ncbi:MAG TPA: Nramp family divalent metal transporter, partial [Spirochaetia bacterium]|nr:Nramp family divalent metal transporter [Spirochaetia bacterium]
MPGKSVDEKTLQDAQSVLSGEKKRGWLKRILPFLGPAFIACVAYIDPGNFATNVQGGSEFGLMLLWVILAANLMAMLLQTLSAKLGIATGMNLAEHCRERLPRWLVVVMWIVAEIAAMATDLAEFLGATLGFSLLFGIPLWIGVILTAIATVIILSLERFGFRPLEAVITGLVGVIAVSYIVEMALVRPPLGQVLFHSVVPNLAGTESVLLAVGILGATVMPHVIFLHSSLTQSRIVVKEPRKLKKLLRFEIADVGIAMGLAGIINMAMLIMAAQTFHVHGLT